MAIKNSNKGHYWQVDDKLKRIAKLSNCEIFPSPKAWERFDWSRKYFVKKPKEGYFIWVKGQPSCHLATCVEIESKDIKQQLGNLIVIEENLKIDLKGFCGSLKRGLKGVHKATGKVILKKGSSVHYLHFHSWKGDTAIEPNYEFLLEPGARLDYTYQVQFAPKTLRLKTSISCQKDAKAFVNILADCRNTNFETKDNVVLKGKNSSGITKLRLIGREKSSIKAYSKILAEAESRGHLDCQGLMVDKNCQISLTPEVICKDREAQVTHEASIGRISEEQLNYLRIRGLTEKEAVNLIIAGFFKV